jgi:hypothetical protein
MTDVRRAVTNNRQDAPSPQGNGKGKVSVTVSSAARAGFSPVLRAVLQQVDQKCEILTGPEQDTIAQVIMDSVIAEIDRIHAAHSKAAAGGINADREAMKRGATRAGKNAEQVPAVAAG